MGSIEAAKPAPASGYSTGFLEVGSQDASHSHRKLSHLTDETTRHTLTFQSGSSPAREEEIPELGSFNWQHQTSAVPTSSICSSTGEDRISSGAVMRLSKSKDYVLTLAPTTRRRVPPGFKDVFSKVRNQNPINAKKREPKPTLGDGFNTCGSLPLGANLGRKRKAPAKIRGMGQLELNPERLEPLTPEHVSNVPNALTRASARKKKKKEPVIFDFSSSPLPPLPLRSTDATNKTIKRKTVKDVVHLEGLPTLSKDRGSRSSARTSADVVGDGARCSPLTTLATSSEKEPAEQVQVAGFEQGVSATTPVQLRLTAEDLFGLRGPTSGRRTDLTKVERRSMAEEPDRDTTGQNGLWRGFCHRKTQLNQPAMVHTVAEVSTPVPLTDSRSFSTDGSSVPALKGASHLNPGEPLLRLELLDGLDMARAGTVSSPSRSGGRGSTAPFALARTGDKRSPASLIENALQKALTTLPTNKTHGVTVRKDGSLQDHSDTVPPLSVNPNSDNLDTIRSLLVPTTNLEQRSDADHVPEDTMLRILQDKPHTGKCQQATSALLDDQATEDSDLMEEAEMHLVESQQAVVDPPVVTQDKRPPTPQRSHRLDIGSQWPRSQISRTKSMSESIAISHEGRHFNAFTHSPPAQNSDVELGDFYRDLEVPQTIFVPETQLRVQNPRTGGSRRAYSDYGGFLPSQSD